MAAEKNMAYGICKVWRFLRILDVYYNGRIFDIFSISSHCLELLNAVVSLLIVNNAGNRSCTVTMQELRISAPFYQFFEPF